MYSNILHIVFESILLLVLCYVTILACIAEMENFSNVTCQKLPDFLFPLCYKIMKNIIIQ